MAAANTNPILTRVDENVVTSNDIAPACISEIDSAAGGTRASTSDLITHHLYGVGRQSFRGVDVDCILGIALTRPVFADVAPDAIAPASYLDDDKATCRRGSRHVQEAIMFDRNAL